MTDHYHTIEKILTEFKNGATYSDSIEKIESLLTAQTTEFVEKLNQLKFTVLGTNYPEGDDVLEAAKNILNARIDSLTKDLSHSL